MCPFCYIGKRNFESALSKYPYKDQIKVEWKSYQLSPQLVTDPNVTLDDMLANHKQISKEQAKSLNQQVSEFAASVGLNYQLDKAIQANTFNAHRLIHFAKANNLQDEMEEALFKAYFTDGKNIDDLPTLTEIGIEIGLNSEELEQTLSTDTYSDAVRADFYEAQQIGVTGVPFFVFNSKKAISGAQPPEVFIQLLEEMSNN